MLFCNNNLTKKLLFKKYINDKIVLIKSKGEFWVKLKIKGKLNNKVNIKQQNSSEEIAIKLKETDYYQGIKLDCRKNINTSKTWY